MADVIGIDVHKQSLTLARMTGRSWQVSQTPQDLARMAARCARDRVSLVVLEPSGGYERPVLAALHAAGVPVARVPTRQVRAFIRGQGIQAKSDPLDARMLALFGTSTQPRLVTAPSAAQTQLAHLTAWRRTLTADLVAKHHQRLLLPAAMQEPCDGLIAQITQTRDRVDREIAELVASIPDWVHQHALLCSCPGIGATTASLLLADLPELGDRDPKALAALVGVAPMTRQSGSQAGTAHVTHGRRTVRTGLWMATRSAIRFNPVIRTFAQRLRAQHKPDKVVMIACMHKLLTILNAMVRTNTPWTANVSA